MTDDANAMPYTDPTQSEPIHRADAVSDPAKDDTEGQDWSTEGGATPAGPATDVDADATDRGIDELRQRGTAPSEDD